MPSIEVGTLVQYLPSALRVGWIGVVVDFAERGRCTYAVVYYSDEYPREEERVQDLKVMEDAHGG